MGLLSPNPRRMGDQQRMSKENQPKERLLKYLVNTSVAALSVVRRAHELLQFRALASLSLPCQSLSSISKPSFAGASQRIQLEIEDVRMFRPLSGPELFLFQADAGHFSILVFSTCIR